MKEYLSKFKSETKETELEGDELTQFLLFVLQKRIVELEDKLGKVERELDYLSQNIQRLPNNNG